MKTKTFGILISFLILLCAACEKDKICTITDPCAPTMRYFPMAIGNYWIYDVKTYNPILDLELLTSKKDTIKIFGDTLIGSNLYYQIQSDRFPSTLTEKDTTYWRDSLGYIVDHIGRIKFTANDVDGLISREIVHESPNFLFYTKSYLQSILINLQTRAGYFECLNYRISIFRNGIKDPRFFIIIMQKK